MKSFEDINFKFTYYSIWNIFIYTSNGNYSIQTIRRHEIKIYQRTSFFHPMFLYIMFYKHTVRSNV